MHPRSPSTCWDSRTAFFPARHYRVLLANKNRLILRLYELAGITGTLLCMAAHSKVLHMCEAACTLTVYNTRTRYGCATGNMLTQRGQAKGASAKHQQQYKHMCKQDTLTAQQHQDGAQPGGKVVRFILLGSLPLEGMDLQHSEDMAQL